MTDELFFWSHLNSLSGLVGLIPQCDKQNLRVILEFTAPGTPQQNSVAERKIPTIMGRVRAMMIEAGLDQQDKSYLYSNKIG